MIINGINVPDIILKAINDDNLVVFAGAGVSKDAPSNLPDFKGLAYEIQRLSQIPFDENRDEIDEFLGDVERNNINVKKHVADVLSAKNARPNKWHYVLLNLFKRHDDIRIVTTNQDELFEAAVKKSGINNITVYNAPALPYGDDFSGIVHLHGRVSDPQHIVVTDTDFGKAYMLNGYATNFLLNLFRKYVVLFIGYSYNDRIVRYLTTAITAENISNAYIFSEETSRKLERTQVKCITYGIGAHSLVCDTLERIGKYMKRGLFDWKQRIMNLDLDTPPVDEDTKEELLDGLKQISVQKHLCSILKGEAWPEWFDRYNIFDALFDEKSNLTELDIIWAYWLGGYYENKLLKLIESHNGKLMNNSDGLYYLNFD